MEKQNLQLIFEMLIGGERDVSLVRGVAELSCEITMMMMVEEI